jgi:dihydrofolate synthase/folylpolyglutamate synthase
VSKDKDASGIVRELIPAVDAAICTRAHHKGAPADDIAAHCELIRRGVVWRTTQTLEEAVDCARDRALAENMIVLVAGGLFLAVEAAVHLNGGDARALRFF